MNIEMEEKESTISGSSSPENTDSGSPTPISSSAVSAAISMTTTGPTNNNHQGVPPPHPQLLPPPPGVVGIPLSLSATNSGKKKRGRPRKYDENGNLNPAYAAKQQANNLHAATAAAAAAAAGGPGGGGPVTPPPGFTLTVSPPPPGEFVVGPKRGRGRGRGSAHHHHGGHAPSPAVSGALSSQPQHWQQQHLSPLPLGEAFAHTVGGDFTPYVITVQTGEDVANTIFSFSQKGPRGICILSANGSVSSVTIRQPGSSSLLTYEGRFEILSLTGSYTVSEADGVKSRSGGLSISLAGPDGRVVGGGVAGWLTAASPIQVVLGSFVPMGSGHSGFKEQKRKYVRQTPTAAGVPVIPETVASASPARHGMPESGACPPAMSFMPAQSHSTEADDSAGSGHNLNNMVSSHNNTPEWNNGTEPSSDHRIYPDINVSVVPGIQ